jgi:hypothetical protein
MKWAIEVQKPRCLSETLAELDSFLYSTIGRMLLTLLTIPVFTAVTYILKYRSEGCIIVTKLLPAWK